MTRQPMPAILRLAELRAADRGFAGQVEDHYVDGDDPGGLLRSLAEDVWYHFHHVGEEEERHVYEDMEATFLRLAALADRLTTRAILRV